MECGEQGGHCDGLIDAHELLVDEIAVQLVHLRALGGERNRAHGADGFDRIFAGRRFGREHHGVGAIEHRVGHIANFRARWHGGGDHALHHLRGGDRELVTVAGAFDHALLQRGHGGVADLNGEIAARDHDAVAGVDDFVERLRDDRFSALNLRDEFRLAARRRQNGARRLHVVSAFGERDGEVIAINFDRRFDVRQVFCRERRCGQSTAQAIDALVV